MYITDEPYSIVYKIKNVHSLHKDLQSGYKY